MRKEIVDFQEHPVINESYRGFEIEAWGSTWTEIVVANGSDILIDKKSKKSYYNSRIQDFCNHKSFQLNDDDGEPIRSTKNGINAAKKLIINSINSALETRERISDWDWGKYLDWYKKQTKNDSPDESQLMEYCISLHRTDLDLATSILSKVPLEDKIWENYEHPIPWFEKNIK